WYSEPEGGADADVVAIVRRAADRRGDAPHQRELIPGVLRLQGDVAAQPEPETNAHDRHALRVEAEVLTLVHGLEPVATVVVERADRAVPRGEVEPVEPAGEAAEAEDPLRHAVREVSIVARRGAARDRHAPAGEPQA